MNFDWQTTTIDFEAADVTITADGHTFTPPAALTVHSDPGDPTYTTLEVTWADHGVEMRIYAYFHADGARWWSDEIRTYDGRVPGNWVYYRGRFFDRPLGQPFDGDLNVASSSADAAGVTGTLRIDGLRLEAFRTPPTAPLATTHGVAPVGGPVSTTVEAQPIARPTSPVVAPSLPQVVAPTK